VASPDPDRRLPGGLIEDRDAWSADRCSVDAALGVVGTRSAMLLMREAFYGARRFEQFARRVGITDAVAAARLRELVDAGLLQRRPYQEPGQRTRQEYVLTAMGRDLLPAVIALMQWGDRWLAGEGGPPVTLTHEGDADCGQPVGVELRCAAGHPVAPRELRAHVHEDERSRAT